MQSHPLNHRLATLRQVEESARHIRDLIANRSDPLPPQKTVIPSTSPRPRLALSSVRPITNDLLRAGVHLDVASRLSMAYCDHAERLKEKLAASYSQSGSSTAEDSDLIHSLYTTHYNKTLQNWFDELVASSTRHGLRSGSKSPADTERQSLFNTGAIPLLEDSYACDPYPSRDVKAQLAKETGMKYRQIHVWFQNRRSRAKREGHQPRPTLRVVSMSSDFEPDVEGPLSKYEVSVEELRHDSQTSREENLGGTRPPHAYPSIYPPSCEVDPFPVRSGQQKFHTPWLRHVASSPISRSQPIDIDTLSKSLSSLSLDCRITATPGDDAGQRCSSILDKITFAVVPLQAPLPSLVGKSSHSSAMGTRRRSSSLLVSRKCASSPLFARPLTRHDIAISIDTTTRKTKNLASCGSSGPYPYMRTRMPPLNTRSKDTSIFSSFRLPISTEFSQLSERFTSMATQLPSWRVAYA